MKFLIIICLLTCFFFSESIAQNSFSVSDTALYVVKKKTNHAVYHVSQLNNLKGQAFKLKWVKYIQKPFPDQWTTTVQDPEKFYNDNKIDSAEFMLPAVTGSFDKMISHVLPNWQVGSGTVRFHVFRPENPKDGVWINFHFTIEEDDVTGIDEETKNFFLLTNTELTINSSIDELLICNAIGQKILLEKNLLSGEKIDLSAQKGILFVKISKKGQVLSKKIVLPN